MNFTRGFRILGIILVFRFPAEATLSGHKSRTQKQIGIFLIFFIKIAGRHTVIGDGSNTKIISNFLFNKNSEVNILPKINEI